MDTEKQRQGKNRRARKHYWKHHQKILRRMRAWHKANRSSELSRRRAHSRSRAAERVGSTAAQKHAGLPKHLQDEPLSIVTTAELRDPHFKIRHPRQPCQRERLSDSNPPGAPGSKALLGRGPVSPGATPRKH